MNVGEYLADRIAFLLIGVFCTALVACVLFVLDVGIAAAVLVVLILASGMVSVLLLDYLRRRKFYDNLKDLAEALEQHSQTYLMSALIDPPHFYEGRLTTDALYSSGKSMNEKVAHYRGQAGEYREYIELWIHEIKTPIAAAHLMLAGMRGPAAAKLSDELSRIEDLVEQVLYYARSTSVEKDYAIREINLAEVCRDTVKKHASVLIGKQVAPVFEIPETLMVFADKKWLQYLVGQIVINAAKYGASSLCFSIEIPGEESPQAHTVLTISDDGCGISAGDISSVFDKGFTGENGRKLGSSTGMGLYLCAQMCERMGLGVGIASEEGTGTRVMLSFPHDRRALEITR